MKDYRGDIDGLRAIAVGSVVAYHFFPGKLPGGYIGVDVFFVISGFLISRIIHNEIANERFSLLRFYERRARRILPALFAVIAVTFAIGLLVLLPSEMDNLARSALAATLFSANLFFVTQTGYFSLAPQEQPLLHTWSLGVEEQFYLFFPLIALLVARYARTSRTAYVVATYAGLAILSLVAAEAIVRADQPAAFYLPHLRAWELLAGVIVSQLRVRPPQNIHANSAISIVALALIAAPVVFYPYGLQFPGLTAIPPVMGAALLIWCGQSDSVVRRLLSLAPFRFVGLISYSLYLWHWPILSFYHNEMVRSSPLHASTLELLPETVGKLALLAGLVAISTLSWKFVEQPFRGAAHGWKLSRRGVALASVSACAVLLFAGAGTVVAQGVPQRFDAETQRLAGYLHYVDYRPGPPGYFKTNWTTAAGVTCTKTDKPSKRVMEILCSSERSDTGITLLFGDSHAQHLSETLRANLDGDLWEISASACHVFDPASPFDYEFCRDLKARAAKLDRLGAPIAALVLVRDWQIADVEALRAALPTYKAAARHVVIVGPVPHYKQRLPALLAVAHQQGDPSIPSRALVEEPFEIDRSLRKLAKEEGVEYFSPIDVLCQTTVAGKTCQTLTKTGIPIQFDGGHMTHEGSDVITRPLSKKLRALTTQQKLAARSAD